MNQTNRHHQSIYSSPGELWLFRLWCLVGASLEFSLVLSLVPAQFLDKTSEDNHQPELQQMSLVIAFIITLMTTILNTLIYGLFVFSKSIFLCCFMITLVTDILNTFMDDLLVFSQITFCVAL